MNSPDCKESRSTLKKPQLSTICAGGDKLLSEQHRFKPLELCWRLCFGEGLEYWVLLPWREVVKRLVTLINPEYYIQVQILIMYIYIYIYL